MLAAADALFATSAAPGDVSMDDIAVAAGVGKGTLFRRFGDRTGLVRAVYDARTADLRTAAAGHEPPLGDVVPPRERLLAVLDAIVTVKLDNRHLSLALEGAPGSGPYGSSTYQWMHELISGLLSALGAPGDRAWRAHALLAATRADLIEHLLTNESKSSHQLRADVAALTQQVAGFGS